MLRKRIYNLIGLFILGVASIGGLYLLTELKNNKSNSFIRKLPPFTITALNVKHITGSNYYIAGQGNGYVYLGNRIVKNLLWRLSFFNLDTTMILLKANKGYSVSEDSQVMIDSSTVYLASGTRGNIVFGNTSDFWLKKSIRTPFFSKFVPLSKNSFLFGSLNEKKQNVLVKQYLGHRSLIFKDSLLKKQVDGLFCTDGIFIHAPKTNKIIYVYYYRNQFIVADTNLNKLYEGKTIDTISRAKIQIGKISRDNLVTLSAPPLYVNLQASANKDYLFVRSALKADNETNMAHKTSAPIDIYSLKDGKYQYSFYLPDFNGQKLVDFKVYDKTLVALFGNYVYTFSVNSL